MYSAVFILLDLIYFCIFLSLFLILRFHSFVCLIKLSQFIIIIVFITSDKNQRLDMIAVLNIQKGTAYRVKNRKTNTYLTSGQEAVTSPLQQAKVSQLWLFDQIKPSCYEIVSLQTGQVLTRKQNSLCIEKGNWSASQFWKLQRAEMNMHQNFFWIVAHDDDSQYLFGSSVSNKVAMKNYDITLFISNWEVQQVDLQKDLKGCCIFKSEYSNLVIDVPEGSNKQGINIIQYHSNGRGNQRWVLQKVLDSYVIRNLCSNMILCPHGKTLKAGNKIIQTQFTNKAQQKWTIQKQREDKFIIKNKADNSLYLGVNSNKQSANIILVSQRQKGTWALDGATSIISS